MPIRTRLASPSRRGALRAASGGHGVFVVRLEEITGLQLAAIEPCAIPGRVGPSAAGVEPARRPREPELRPERYEGASRHWK